VTAPGPGTGWSTNPAPIHVSWSGLAAPWRQAVQQIRIMMLCDLLRLKLTTPDQIHERAFLIGELLKDANIASRQRLSLPRWWWGTEIERAWARLHEVGQRTVDLLPEAELLTRATFAAAHGNAYLTPNDQRLQHLQGLRDEAAKAPKPPAPPLEPPALALRSAIVEVMRATQKATDQKNQQARYFRNRLVIASLVSFVFAVVLVFVQGCSTDVEFVKPPTDWHGSAWAFLVVMMIFGSIGALFTTIPAMAKIPLDFSPFNLPYQQALLKILFGPLVAVIGIGILGSGALSVKAPTTLPALALFAVFFGAGQHVVTRYVDERASVILRGTAPAATKGGTKDAA
jgi:hypothetical protein